MVKIPIKQLLFILFCTVFIIETPAQENTAITTKNYPTFSITTAEHNKLLVNALFEADLDRYRYKNKQAILKFENGETVTLKSANELKDKGISVDETKIKDETAPQTTAVFDLHDSGIIIEKLSITPLK